MRINLHRLQSVGRAQGSLKPFAYAARLREGHGGLLSCEVVTCSSRNTNSPGTVFSMLETVLIFLRCVCLNSTEKKCYCIIRKILAAISNGAFDPIVADVSLLSSLPSLELGMF